MQKGKLPMKKAISLLCTVVLMLSAVQTFAFADIVDPRRSPAENSSMLPVLLIAIAVIVVAVVIWRVRCQKK
jgi:uncharacterized membrane protein